MFGSVKEIFLLYIPLHSLFLRIPQQSGKQRKHQEKTSLAGKKPKIGGNLRKVFIYESMFIYVFQRGDMIAKVFVLIFISTGEMIRFDE